MTADEASGQAATAPPRALQAAIDDMLIVHGAYIPVELLLALEGLRYAGYDAWRCLKSQEARRGR